jgi:hypothetical protein
MKLLIQRVAGRRAEWGLDRWTIDHREWFGTWQKPIRGRSGQRYGTNMSYDKHRKVWLWSVTTDDGTRRCRWPEAKSGSVSVQEAEGLAAARDRAKGEILTAVEYLEAVARRQTLAWTDWE